MPKKKMNEKVKVKEIIGKFEDYYKENHTYIPLQSNKINLSDEDRELINNHPEIFFQASRSRILLLVWLCKILRSTFELYGYSDLDMPNETYEILRSNFKTKAFNRTSYLTAFNCTTSNTLNYTQFVEIEQKYIQEYNKYVDEEKKLSLMPHIGIRKKVESTSYLKELSNIFNSKRNTEIIYLRSQGKTLDEIGESLGITRERARQLEFKPKNNIERWLASREHELFSKLTSNNLVNEKKAQKEFGEKEWQIVKYVIISNQKNDKLNWRYFEPFDLVYFSTKEKLEDVLLETKTQIQNEESTNILPDFTEKIKEKGFTFWTEELTQNYFKLNNYNIYNKQIHEGKMTITKSIGIIAKKYFPNGIKITNQEQLEEFAKRTNEMFNLNVSARRALLTRIQDTLVMSDKGEYSSPEQLIFNEEMLSEITNYINNMEEERITYEALFKVFEKELKEKTNVDNHYYLHGALKHLTNSKKTNLLCYRYYVGKPENEKTKSKEFFRIFYNYLKEKDSAVSIEQLLKDFPTWNEMYFRYSMTYFPSITQWTKNEYICLESLNITEKDSKEITKIVDKFIDNDIGYTSHYVIYNYFIKNNPDLLEKLQIDDDSKMYHVLNYIVGDKYYCRRPHILKEWDKAHFSAQDLIKLVLDKKEIVNKPQVMNELVELYGNKNSSLNLSLQKELEDYIKISTHDYIKKSKLSFNKNDLNLISSLIKKDMIKGEVLLPNTIKDFSAFPKTTYKWTPWLLCEIVQEFNLDFKVVGNRNTPSQNTMMIVLKTNSSLNNKQDVFNWLLENDYSGEKSVYDIFQYAKKTGIFHTNLTSDDIKKYIGGNL